MKFISALLTATLVTNSAMACIGAGPADVAIKTEGRASLIVVDVRNPHIPDFEVLDDTGMLSVDLGIQLLAKKLQPEQKTTALDLKVLEMIKSRAGILRNYLTNYKDLQGTPQLTDLLKLANQLISVAKVGSQLRQLQNINKAFGDYLENEFQSEVSGKKRLLSERNTKSWSTIAEEIGKSEIGLPIFSGSFYKGMGGGCGATGENLVLQ